MSVKRSVVFVWVLVLCMQMLAAVKWYNPLDNNGILLHGRAWKAETGGNFHRLPDRAKPMVCPAVWGLSCQSAGLYVKFCTNAPTITVKYTVKGGRSMAHMPMTGVSGVDLYVTDTDGTVRWCSGKYAFGDTITYVYNDINGSAYHRKGYEFTLYLPLYNEVDQLQIGVADEALFRFYAPSHEKPIVVYGTSIAQGACASRPGMAWTNILQRCLDRPVVNLGFSGNGQLEKALFELMAEIDAAVFVVDCMPNMTGERVGLIDERLRKGVELLRAKSAAPILLVEHDGYMGSWASDKCKEEFVQTNEQLRKTYESLKDNVPGLYYLSYDELSLSMDSQVDGIHATDWGMQQYAEAYENKIRSILEPPVAENSAFVPRRQRRDANTYEWNDRHEAVLALNRTLRPDYVFIGNSITHFWGGEPVSRYQTGASSWNELFDGKKVVNMGFGWDRIENVLWRIHHGELDGFKAKKVFLMIGTNNLDVNTDKEIAEGITEAVTHIHYYQPKAEIVVIGVLPRRKMEKRIAELNKMVFKKMKSYAYVRTCDASAALLTKGKQINEMLFRDGLHPNEQGYERILLYLKKFVDE